MRYRSTKTYGHEIGLSCAFRQWRAESHCRLLHGYSIAIRFEFEAASLDESNWVVDFGDLKTLKLNLEAAFDHATIIAIDDPERAWFEEAQRRGILRLVMLPATGCEKFAEWAYLAADQWLHDAGYAPRCRVASVEVREHGANSAIYVPS